MALGLTMPNRDRKPAYTAQHIAALYEREGKQIFSRSMWHTVHSGFGLVDEKYPANGLEQVLEDYFGSARLKDALTDVLIASYEIEQRFPFFFRSSRAKLRPDYDFPMKLVARATSAAPTYFEPLKLPADPTDTVEYYALVDGAVYANNPAMCAYVEARSLHKEVSDFLVVSLGTGELTRNLPYDKAKDWGLARWAQPILSVIFDGVSDTVDYQLKQILPDEADGTRYYYRFQPSLEHMGSDDMDDASQTNIYALKTLAENTISKANKEIEHLCAQLVQ